MARIPDSALERLKQEVSVQRLAEARGILLRPHGADLIGLCPFHEDHAPSLVISPAKNLWHCLGACQAGGSVIDWVIKAEGVSFRQAVEIVRHEGHFIPSPTSRNMEVKKPTVPEQKATGMEKVDRQEALRQVVETYHAALKQSPEALAYLEKRGLRSVEMIDHFRLGYSNGTLGESLPSKAMPEGAAIRGCLQELGILRKTGHEHFRGSLVIPIFDEQSQVTEVYGRKIASNVKPGTPEHLYLPGPHHGVFNIRTLKASEEIILCEALIDALTFWCAGFQHVTASYGIEGFTPDHREAFRKYGTKRVLIAYDRDEAGDRAAAELAETLLAEGLLCFRIQFPREMDANAYALKVQPAKKSLELVLSQAVWMGKGKGPARSFMSRVESNASSEAEVATKKEKEGLETGGEDEAVFLPPQPLFPLAAKEAVVESTLATDVFLETQGEEVTLHLGDRRWRIRGLCKNRSSDQLKVNLLVSHEEIAADECLGAIQFHVDSFDLYSARQRAFYIKQAAEELALPEEAIKKDLGTVLLKLEALQEQASKERLPSKERAVELSAEEKQEAFAWLRDPKLIERILADFERCGVVGEATNTLLGYVAAVSRKLEDPLAVVIQSSSAAGKTQLMEAILAFLPEEERVKYSAMSGQSLFYMGEKDLRHKVLAIVEEEGAERASYALKLLQSEGELTMASTGKDPATGRLTTHEYRVEGPVMIFLTTTAIEIDEELLNRCIVLTVDEEREQTRAIHRLQREQQTLEGLLARRDRQEILRRHQNAQRLLRPILVANPYARELTFLDDRTRTRRDHMKYLTLIRAIALLHQYQRPQKMIRHQGQDLSYIEVSLEDIAVANRLAHQVLGRSLDELAPQTRRLLMFLEQMAQDAGQRRGIDRREVRFTRRDVRQFTKWGNTQLKLHLHRLEELEYLIVHRGGRGQQFVYELLYDGSGKDGTPFLPGLLDVARLRAHGSDANRSGVNEETSGRGRGQVGPKSAPGRGGKNGKNTGKDEPLAGTVLFSAKNA